MRRPASPTLDLLGLFGLTFLLQQVGGLAGLGPGWVALAAPAARPWTLVTSVYAHATLAHLVGNAVALAVVGFPLERFTTRARFHGFVLGTGMVAGVVELLASGLVGRRVAVLGASGGILALYGYALAGNPLTDRLLDRANRSRRVGVALVGGTALAVTVLAAGASGAFLAHLSGVALGLVAGRLRLLSAGSSPDRDHR